MAGLKEKDVWEREIYQIEEDDPVHGGEDGITNKPTRQLANRTLHLRNVLTLAGQQIKPKKLTATTKNAVDATGHTHEIALASTTEKGLVQLTNDTGLDSEVLGFSAKGAKKLAQEISQVRLNQANFIANNKKSDAVNSTSSDTVATSAAVKTAYDLAASKQSPATTLAGYGITDGVKQQDLRANFANNRSYENATPEQLPLGTFVGLSSKAGLTSNNAHGWELISKGGGDASGVYACVRLGITGNKFYYQTARDWRCWNTPVELANAESVVKKSGDTMTGALAIHSSEASGTHHSQYQHNAPVFVQAGNAQGVNNYYPYIKGRVSNGGGWASTFSFGYTTGNGRNKWGEGTIVLNEDNGHYQVWRFLHNGDFVSAGDVKSDNGKSLNLAVQSNEMVGQISYFACSSPPSGWLKANGAAVSRTAYATLFARIGTTFGAGDGRTTFNLPDLRGEFIRGWDDGRNVDSHRRIGSAQGDAIKTHSISVPNSQFEGNVEGSWFYSERGNGNNNQTSNAITYNGANETRPRNIALLACIKY